MKAHQISDILYYCFTVLISILYFIGIPSVPFHPDESTQIYMSSDVEAFLSSPTDLFWQEHPQDLERQKYRELDAPLTRTLIGLGRLIFGLEALPVDWNWSKDWQQNEQNGALPDQDLLIASRFFVAWLFPFSILLIYQTGKIINARTAGWVAAILFISNPLIWLHTRRAMAESVLVFSIILSVFIFLKFPNRIWISAIPVALAFNSKQTSAGLILCGLIIIALGFNKKKMKEIILSLFLFLIIFGTVSFLFNPFVWSNPFRSVQQALYERQSLILAQINDFGRQNENLVLNTVAKKSGSMIGHLFFVPLQYAETQNNLQNLQNGIIQYGDQWINNNPFFVLQRGLLLFLSFLGFIYLIIMAMRKFPYNHNLMILFLSFFLTAFVLFISIPLAFQRYYVPIIPFLSMLSGFTFSEILILLNRVSNKTIND